MTDATVYDTHWHLAHSQPSVLLDYFNPTRGFIPQINILFSRFKAIQTLCDAGQADEPLTRLRNELAFIWSRCRAGGGLISARVA